MRFVGHLALGIVLGVFYPIIVAHERRWTDSRLHSDMAAGNPLSTTDPAVPKRSNPIRTDRESAAPGFVV